jgi:hypothetical protein
MANQRSHARRYPPAACRACKPAIAAGRLADGGFERFREMRGIGKAQHCRDLVIRAGGAFEQKPRLVDQPILDQGARRPAEAPPAHVVQPVRRDPERAGVFGHLPAFAEMRLEQLAEPLQQARAAVLRRGQRLVGADQTPDQHGDDPRMGLDDGGRSLSVAGLLGEDLREGRLQPVAGFGVIAQVHLEIPIEKQPDIGRLRAVADRVRQHRVAQQKRRAAAALRPARMRRSGVHLHHRKHGPGRLRTPVLARQPQAARFEEHRAPRAGRKMHEPPIACSRKAGRIASA